MRFRILEHTTSKPKPVIRPFKNTMKHLILFILVLAAAVATHAQVPFEIPNIHCNYTEQCHSVAVWSVVCYQGNCVCDPRYYGENCAYARKSKLAAFVFSFFFGGLGVDRFYLGYIGIGVAKLLYNLFAVCTLGSIAACFKACDSGCMAALFGILSLLSTIGSFIWWVYDWSAIIGDILPDALGVALYINW